jgi:5-methylcytosine-specific restriction enzyme subunit McrC
MKKNRSMLTVFEHQTIRLNELVSGVKFEAEMLGAMQRFFGEDGIPYYSLAHNGIRFCEYVGVIQIGNLTIEILPKSDREGGKSDWRKVLIGMLKAIGLLQIQAPTSSILRIKPNSILDLYIELFIDETENLFHSGLIKKYRKVSGNCTALKGNLLFHKNIQHNLVHQERFYVRHTVYEMKHILNAILYKTLVLLKRINTHPGLISRIGSLLLDFPEQEDLTVSEVTFSKIIFDRKNKAYRSAVEIARLLLLNYHPDVNRGNENVLALMFDMNLLWEQFVYVSIRDHIKMIDKRYTITKQTFKYFWKPQRGNRSFMKPDIVISHYDLGNIVLDTKWKILNSYNPSPEDLRQLYVYHEFFAAKRVALIYPNKVKLNKGFYYTKDNLPGEKECAVMGIQVESDPIRWQRNITLAVVDWIQCK